MKNLKKALKKLAGLKSSKPAGKSASAAAKSKPKTAVKASGGKAAAKSAPSKKGAAKVAAKPVKGKAPAGKKAEVKGLTKTQMKALAAKEVAAKKAADKAEAKKVAQELAAAGKKAKAANAAAEKEAARINEKLVAKSLKLKEEEAAAEEEIVLTDAEGRRYCRVKECDQLAAVELYCRYHYLLFWKNIQNRKKILSEGKLERYIEELTARYPDKYLEMLKKDLRSEKEFTAAIQELEIDESGVDAEYEDEAQSYLEEVRGMGGSSNEAPARDEEDF